jgi:monoamine oxidase
MRLLLLLCSYRASIRFMDAMRDEFDIVVVGAGVAGLSAACELQAAGRNACVLEARSRVGGRIDTVVNDGGAMELGAEFVHGEDPLLWALLKEAKLETLEVDGSDLCVTDDRLAKCGEGHAGAFRILEEISSKLSPDVSFAEYVQGVKATAEERAAATRYVEGFNAADAGKISARSLAVQQRAEDAISGDRSWRVAGGYAQLPTHLLRKFLAGSGDLRLDTTVTAIEWRRGDCTVRAGDLTLKSRCVLVTVPLGVLQRRGIRFRPEPAALGAADHMAMGTAHRLGLRFKKAFWKEGDGALKKERERLSFLFAEEKAVGPFKVWWTQHPDERPIVTAWCGGSAAEMMTARLRAADGAEKLVKDSIVQLARVFERDASWLERELVEWRFHNWSEDRFAWGAYSYVVAGELEAPFLLAAPAEDTLFFAGEHTDVQGHWGTVHAALASGYRAARQLLRG